MHNILDNENSFFFFIFASSFIQNSFDNRSHHSPSLTEADPLPQGIPQKLLIRNLIKEVHHLKKKLKKMEDELQQSRKNCSELTVETTHLCKVHKKELMSFINRKSHLYEELEQVRRLGGEKVWALTAKASSLEVELRATRERIKILEGSSAWSTSRTKYDWDWSKRFSELQNQLQEAEDSYNNYRQGWCSQVADLQCKLQKADGEIAQLHQRLSDRVQIDLSRDS